MIDLDDLETDLRGDRAAITPRQRAARRANIKGMHFEKGRKKGRETVAQKARLVKSPVTLPAISIQKRGE